MTSSFVLNFNQAATTALAGNTRLRLKSVKRGGQTYLALRPSYRVSGKNTKVQVTPGAEGTSQVTIDKADIEASGSPVPEVGTSYQFFGLGYGWFILKPLDDANTETKLVNITSPADAVAETVESTETIITPAAEVSAEVQAPKEDRQEVAS